MYKTKVVFKSDVSLHPPKLKDKAESEYCKQYNESADVPREGTKLRRSKSECKYLNEALLVFILFPNYFEFLFLKR